MAEQRLSRAARNDLFQRVQATGLSPQDFDWDPSDPLSWLNALLYLRHVPTTFWFMVKGTKSEAGEYIAVSYRPERLGILHSVDRHAESWTAVLPHFEAWLRLVKAEHETPDLWEAAANAQAIVAVPFASADTNQPFTAAEQTRIRAALNEFREHVEATTDLTEPQQQEVRRRFQYLAGAAERLGRLDWFEMLVSNIVGLALGRVLDPKAITDVMHTAHRMFGWMLTEGAKLIGG